MKFLGIDIGGTCIKGAVVDEQYDLPLGKFPINKVKSPLHAHATSDKLIDSLKELHCMFWIEQ